MLRRVISRVVTAGIPRIREESQDQLALRSKTIIGSLQQSISFVVWTVTFMMILSEVGVNTAPVLTTAALAGLAVGFAAQNTIRDYLHGFLILVENRYRVGEVAIVAGIGDLMEDIALWRTVLWDLDGTTHVIPNGKIELASNMTRSLRSSTRWASNCTRTPYSVPTCSRSPM